MLCLSQALNCLVDDRFTGLKHFWSATVCDRPRKEKHLEENIVTYEDEGDFSEEEKIQHLVSLTGVFPMELVMSEHIRGSLDKHAVPAISDYDKEYSSGVVWFVPREIIRKKTRNGKDFYIVKVVDDNSEMNSIKCWGVRPDKDIVRTNRPYMAKLDWDPQWGFSARGIGKTFRMLA